MVWGTSHTLSSSLLSQLVWQGRKREGGRREECAAPTARRFAACHRDRSGGEGLAARLDVPVCRCCIHPLLCSMCNCTRSYLWEVYSPLYVAPCFLMKSDGTVGRLPKSSLFASSNVDGCTSKIPSG